MLSRLVIAFLPRSKRLLISWLQSPSAVILEPPKIKSDFHFSLSCIGEGNVKRLLRFFRLLSCKLQEMAKLREAWCAAVRVKSRDLTLPTKIHLLKALVFPVVMYGCESWTVKKAEH